MIKSALVAVAAICLSGTASAATWFTLPSVGGEEYIEFFDLDTVVKAGSTVTVWEKTFYDTQTIRPKGTYSFAARTTYDCKARTLFVKTESSYDKDGYFVRTWNAAPNDTPTELIPGTIGESSLKLFCSPSFPHSSDTHDYFPALNNNPAAAAKAFFDYMRAQKADPAPK